MRRRDCSTDSRSSGIKRIEGFSHNPKNRCYLCKHELFEKIRSIAERENIAEIAEGSNLDDNGDYRPGLQASMNRITTHLPKKVSVYLRQA